MNGDVKIINNKLCYEFGYDPKITNLAPGQVMRKSDGSNWIIEDIDRVKCIVWCYQTEAGKNQIIEELKNDITNLQLELTDLQSKSQSMNDQYAFLFSKYYLLEDKLDNYTKDKVELYNESLITRLKLFIIRAYLKLRNFIYS